MYFVELHDAEVVSLTSVGTVRILEISHINLYVEKTTPSGGFQTFSYSARLHCSEVSSWTGSGKLGRVLDAEGLENLVQLTRTSVHVLHRELGPRKMTLTFGGGGRLSVECRTCELELLENLGYVEDWDGELWDETSRNGVLFLTPPPLIDSSAASETDEEDQTDGDGAEDESSDQNE